MKAVITGKFRAYFNCRSAFPLVWSIDNGRIETEINVSKIRFHYESNRCTPLETCFERVVDTERTPSVWLEGVGRVEITEGVADIYL